MTAELPPRLVLVGAGHAHLQVIDNIQELVGTGAHVTVISPGDFWYSGMGPGVLGGCYTPEQDRIEVGQKVRGAGGTWVQDKVTAIEPNNRTLQLTDGRILGWDVLSLNVGSVVPLQAIEGGREHGIPVKPVQNLARLSHVWKERPPEKVVVVGGGPAGCEVAANSRARLEALNPRATVTVVTRAPELLPDLPKRARRLMHNWCADNGVEVRTGCEVIGVREHGVDLADGTSLPACSVLIATGVKPPPLAVDSGLDVTSDGGMIVGPTLQSASHPRVFGAGDCVSFPHGDGWLDRVGVYAVRSAPTLYRNLVQAVSSTADPGDWNVEEFHPQEKYVLVLNLGDGTGIFVRGGIALHGRLAFKLKDWLDQRFMDQYRE